MHSFLLRGSGHLPCVCDQQATRSQAQERLAQWSLSSPLLAAAVHQHVSGAPGEKLGVCLGRAHRPQAGERAGEAPVSGKRQYGSRGGGSLGVCRWCRWKDVHTHHAVLPGRKKEAALAMCDSVDRPRGHCAT